MNIIAIDPGWNGAVAFFTHSVLHSTSNCPSSREPIEMVNIIEKYKAKKTVVYIERVWSRPYERGAFTFGKNYGIWLGICNALDLPIVKVLPKEWQSEIGNRIPKEYQKRKQYFKRRAKTFAGSKHKVTLKNADAICIGMYALKKEDK
tara:strand:- start:44 stop:487 length:444 start_codon:yes stop_codon:yes gene_type:complete